MAVSGWSVGWTYAKSAGLGGSAYAEYHGVLVGRLLGAEGRKSVGVGLGRSKKWRDTYEPCISGCPSGWSRRTDGIDEGEGWALALSTGARTRPWKGFMGLGIELHAFVGAHAPAFYVNGMVDVGWLR